MSAHVVAKSQVYASAAVDEEDEKTTIESGWEEEASTTVEHGEVAEKLRALGTEQPVAPRQSSGHTTGVTSTSATSLDEPTVDDQRANAQIANLPSPYAADVNLDHVPPGRLIVTTGNDVGQEIEVIAGKTYSIGRAIDNDFVLTDIAVSRKHFDLRADPSGWLVADRGSGNGTVVNGHIEDHPYKLAHGDAIEIGNTTFRFDLPQAAPAPLPRATPAQATPHVARPQSYAVDIDMGSQGGAEDEDDEDDEASTVAGKPLPNLDHPPPYVPPVRPKTMPPPMPPPARSRTNTGSPAYSASPPVPIQPARAISHRSPTQPPMPAYLVDPRAAELPPMGHRMPSVPSAHPQSPTVTAEPLSPQLLDDRSAPQGAPMMLPAYAYAPEQGYYPPQALQPPSQPPMYVDASQNGRNDPSTAHVSPTPYNGMQVAMFPPAAAPAPAIGVSRRIQLVLGGAALTLLAAAATIAIIKHSEAGSVDTTPPPPVAAAPAPAATPVAPVAPKPVAAKPPSAIAVTPIKPPAPTVTPLPVPQINATPIAVAPVPTPPPAPIPAPTPAPAPAPTPHRDPTPAPAPRIARVTPPPAPHVDPVEQPPPAPRHTGDASAVRARADSLYQKKQFADAARTLRAASGLSGDDARELKSLAGAYDGLNRNYAIGTAPSTKAVDAYLALQAAASFDRVAGGQFVSEIQGRMGALAPKVAFAYMAKGQYEDAATAVRVAEAAGAGKDSTASVRRSLEQKAGEIYAQAETEMDSNPKDARAKLGRIKNMVDAKSTWAVKAAKLASGGG